MRAGLNHFQVRDTLLSIPERDGIAADADVQNGKVVVIWWIPGDRSRVVRAEVNRRETRVGCADCHGGAIEFRAGPERGSDLIGLVRTGIDWLTGDRAKRAQAVRHEADGCGDESRAVDPDDCVGGPPVAPEGGSL
jgi:hypothetical protein